MAESTKAVYRYVHRRSQELQMTDAALDNAVSLRDDRARKIADAERQINEWRADMERAEAFIRAWEEFAGVAAPAPAVTTEDTSPTVSEKPARAKNPKKEEVAATVRTILLEHGEPMDRTEVLDALTERGMVIHGGDPAVVLQTMLWRTRDVNVHLKGHGYWPTDTAWAPAEYDPNVETESEEQGASDQDDADLDDEAAALI
jgi:hypothetical protein